MCIVLVSLAGGCGTTKSNTATEHLLMSDAVDGAVARIDFTPLRGQRVYFNTEYIRDYKGIAFVNSSYVISSLRQQMIAAGLLLQDKIDEADFVVEGRIGALGQDAHEVIYGIPSTGALTEAADAVAAFSHLPSVPGIPELAVAKRSNQIAAAKLAVFAYESKSKERVWQSGMTLGKATAKDLWVMGAGPFQRGTIHDGGVKFAGSAVNVPLIEESRSGRNGSIASFRKETIFSVPGAGQDAAEDSEVQQVSGEESTDK